MESLEEDENKVEVQLNLASGKEICVSVSSRANVSDVCQAARAHLEPGQTAKCAKNYVVLDGEETVKTHLPGPWQVSVGFEKKELVRQARRAEEESCYEDMINYMRSVAQLDEVMTDEDCKLLSTAYTSCIGRHRVSWKVCATEELRASQAVEIRRLATELLDLLGEVKAKAGESGAPSRGNYMTWLWCMKLTADL